jgi:hypothetical protein
LPGGTINGIQKSCAIGVVILELKSDRSMGGRTRKTAQEKRTIHGHAYKVFSTVLYVLHFCLLKR